MTWLLAAIIVLAPAYLIRFQLLGAPTTLLEVGIGVFLLTVISKFRASDWKKLKSLGQVNWAIGLFVLAAIVATIVSPEKGRALGQLKAFIIEPVLVFYAIIIVVRKKEQLYLVLRSLFWAAVTISIFGIIQHYTFIFLPIRFWGSGSEVARIVSVFEYPNALSLYLAPLLGFFMALWFSNVPLTNNRWISAMGLGLISWALILTYSRGAWIAAVVGILYVLFKNFEFKKVALPLLITAFLLLMLPGVRTRLSLGLSDASSSAHYELLKIGADKAFKNPILGNGLYGFRTTQVEARYGGEILNYPHNFILNFWLELGILGLAAFIWILVLALRQNKNRGVITFAAGVYLLIMLVHGLVDVPYFKNDLSILFWFIISLYYL